ncbi:S-layer homology domain-containing protein [Sporomusa acidovorans]|uniref:SLH domain-containing protein n=1 Tax=Sporomusa acidovorans (strain ATCC 49682 / DSM 3132 / Mol) TaxID=1123286 RepID=A0ABZ3JAG9_SPOA4|nr:S-layer homology domain-containing protein [Sporomusa acidovorans]OZC21834.1 outer membrane protein alpha precursor [Sporomusa acidovorans DSM 3132]SDD55454.1 S-layer homology domain-containing protein [Sporomusa acidovorans]
MKKSIVILASLTAFCLTNISVSAAGPFSDVPANHWSYGAVSKLAQDGIVSGYGNNAFHGDQLLTRYEMAQVVARAMEKSDKASAEDKDIINKLSQEYSKELTNLGVRVSELEKKSDKLTYWGFLHLSDQVWNNSGVFKGVANPGDTPHPNEGHYPAIGYDLYLNYKVNDKWSFNVETEAVRDTRTGGYWTSFDTDGGVAASQRDDMMYAEGTVGTTKIKAGKFDYSPAYALVICQGRKALNGVEFTVGDKVKTSLAYGYLRQNWTGNPLNTYLVSESKDNHYASLSIDVPLTSDSNFKAAYHSVKNDGTDKSLISDNINIWEVGADKMLTKDLDFFATYARSNADTNNEAYIIGLTKGHAIPSIAKSFQITARYLYAEGYSTIAPDNYWIGAYHSQSVGYHGLKGPELTAMYMFDKNIGMTAWASNLSTTDGAPGKLRTVKAEFDFFF